MSIRKSQPLTVNYDPYPQIRTENTKSIDNNRRRKRGFQPLTERLERRALMSHIITTRRPSLIAADTTPALTGIDFRNAGTNQPTIQIRYDTINVSGRSNGITTVQAGLRDANGNEYWQTVQMATPQNPGNRTSQSVEIATTNLQEGRYTPFVRIVSPDRNPANNTQEIPNALYLYSQVNTAEISTPTHAEEGEMISNAAVNILNTGMIKAPGGTELHLFWVNQENGNVVYGGGAKTNDMLLPNQKKTVNLPPSPAPPDGEWEPLIQMKTTAGTTYNWGKLQLTVTPKKPDLAAQSVSIPSSAETGASTWVEVTIANTGKVKSDTTNADIYYLDIAHNLPTNVATVSIPSMEPGTQQLIHVNFIAPAIPAKDYRVVAIVNASLNDDPKNNAAISAGSVTLTEAPKPSHIVPNIPLAPHTANAGETVMIQGTVENTGGASKTPDQLTFIFQDPLGNELMRTTAAIPPLPENQSYMTTANFTLPTNLQTGTYTFIAETSGGERSAPATMNIDAIPPPKPKANLTFAGPPSPQAFAKQGLNTKTYVYITNTGIEDSSSFTYTLTAINEQQQETLVYTGTHEAITPKQEGTYELITTTWQVPTTLTPGVYKIKATIIPTNGENDDPADNTTISTETVEISKSPDTVEPYKVGWSGKPLLMGTNEMLAGATLTALGDRDLEIKEFNMEIVNPTTENGESINDFSVVILDGNTPTAVIGTATRIAPDSHQFRLVLQTPLIIPKRTEVHIGIGGNLRTFAETSGKVPIDTVIQAAITSIVGTDGTNYIQSPIVGEAGNLVPAKAYIIDKTPLANGNGSLPENGGRVPLQTVEITQAFGNPNSANISKIQGIAFLVEVKAINGLAPPGASFDTSSFILTCKNDQGMPTIIVNANVMSVAGAEFKNGQTEGSFIVYVEGGNIPLNAATVSIELSGVVKERGNNSNISSRVDYDPFTRQDGTITDGGVAFALLTVWNAPPTKITQKIAQKTEAHNTLHS